MGDYIFNIGELLGIKKYAGEKDQRFYARVVYSALSEWMFSIASADIRGETKDGYVSKAKMHREASSVLSSFIQSKPAIKEWFYPTDSTDPINLIRDPLLVSKSLIDIGYRSQIALAKRNNTVPLTGISYNKTGLLSFSRGDKEAIAEELRQQFGFREEGYEQFLNKYLRQCRWSNFDDKTSYEYFDTHRAKVFSDCWDSNITHIKDEVLMSRRLLSFGVYDYKLIRIDNGKIYQATLPQYAQHEAIRDTQRLLYALKAKYGNKAQVKVDKFPKYTIIHFWSKLPPSVDKYMRYIGWPLEDIENKRNEFVIRNEFYKDVDRLLKSLGIEVTQNE